MINGELAGATVADLRVRLGAELVGDLDPARIFPVLTKIITAHDWLSVQVHPDDAYAQRVEHQPFGKTECWYVLAAQPNSQIVYGWTRDTSRAEYQRRVADGTLGELLRHIELKAGDTVYIPHGLVHAIGPGLTVFETQQASDLTYRMFDYNRVGLDGKPRELHVQKAADVLNYRATTGNATQISYRFDGLERTALIADEHFVVERIVAVREPASIATQARPLILMALDAPLAVTSGDSTVTLPPYQTALVPAASQWCTVSAAAERCGRLHVRDAPAERRAARGAATGRRSRPRADRSLHGAVLTGSRPGRTSWPRANRATTTGIFSSAESRPKGSPRPTALRSSLSI